ncbi:hypothetical protein [Blastococcus tunisiensis]|nr:hypothetical protein [Blastococcus sp. DSM 46838]
MVHATAPKDSSLTEERDLHVTEEYFDYLQTEADRPARTPNPKMVSFFRSMRGTIKHQ